MNKLQERRVFLGLTQPDVSRELRKVDPRMDVGMVSRFERGACLPTAAVLKRLTEVLQASVSDLYGAEDMAAMEEQNGGEVTAEPTENAKTLAAFLRYGAEQAQTRGELCRLTGWTDRVVRQAVEDARKAAGDDGPFIVTAVGGRGYYLTDDPDEIDRHYRGEYARAMSILVSTKGERRYLKKRGRL